jgi:hypothetical protein
VVLGRELCPVRAGRNPVLLLHRQRWQTRLPQGGQFRSGRPKIHTPGTTVIAHAIVRSDVHYVRNVSIVDGGDVHVRHLAVVVELVIVPISTVVSAADVAVAVVHASVVADVAAPVTTMPSVAVGLIAPVSGSP